MKMMHGRGLLMVTAAVVAAGCSDLGTEPEILIPSAIQIGQPVLQFSGLGESKTVQATVLDQAGRPMPGAVLAFVADDPSVLTVGTGGQVQARANGETVVRLRVDAGGGVPTPSGYRAGVVEASIPVTVRQEVWNVKFGGGLSDASAPLLLWAIGQRRQIAVEVRDPMGSLLERPVEIQLVSESPAIAEVSGTGTAREVRAVNDGAAVLRATAEGKSAMLGVEIRSGFSFAACVSSSASRLVQRTDPSATGAIGCSSVQMRALMDPR
jgi:hypothetical protein